MRRRAIALSLVAVALAILAIAGEHRIGTAPDASPTTPRTDAAPPSTSTLAPAPQPRREPAARPVRSAPPKGSLRVRVLAAGAPAVGAVVRAGGRGTGSFRPRAGWTTGTADADGFVEIDTAGMSFLVNLDTIAEGLDKAEIDRIVSIDVSLEGWSSGHAEVDLGKGPEAREVPVVTIDLRHVATIVGRVLGPDGTPIGATAEAVADEDTPPEGTRSLGEGVVAGDDGRFRLAVDAEGPALLLVGRGDARPATLSTTLIRGREVDVGDVRLDRGFSLAGRVRCRGIAPSRTSVIATWYGPGFDSVRAASHGHLWVVNRRALWSQLEVHPDAEGRFRIGGLEPGPYRVRVQTDDWGCALHPDAYAEVDRIVRAPDERLDVDADRSLFQLNVRDGTDVIPNPHVTVDGRDEIVLDGGSEGQVGVVLRAGARHHVVVRARGYVRTVLEITAAEAGGRRLETVTLVKAGPTDEYDTPAFAREPSGAAAAIVGPDGVPFAVPFRFFDSDGNPVRAETWDTRPVVEIDSSTRTSVSGVTTFVQSETTEAHRYVEVGGGLVETKRIDFDGTEDEPGHRPPTILLHAR